MRLADRVCIVTGAASGIGAAIAEAFAREGARLVATDIDPARGAARVARLGDRAGFFAQDVADERSWMALREHVLAAHGRLDVLVNNAGLHHEAPITELALEDFRRINRVNVEGTFLGTKYAVRIMTETAADGARPTGSIVNIASILAHVGLPKAAAYCASKGAVRILTKSVAVECGARRDLIRVNSINPGIIRTAMTESLVGPDPWQAGQPLAVQVPLRTFGAPADVAAAALFLASG